MKKIDISCPITATMSIIGGKWKTVILWYLKDNAMRFTQLKKIIPECSLKMFNDNLKELEKDRILTRTVYAEVPPRVEYGLSEYGKSLMPIIIAMRQWGVKHLLANPNLMADNQPLQEIISMIIDDEFKN